MENYDESAAVMISPVFLTHQYVDLEKCSKTGAFGHSSNHISRSQ